MKALRLHRVAMALLLSLHPIAVRTEQVIFPTHSQVPAWVDSDTPSSAYSYTTSRGDTWELVMSDEFSDTSRSFRPGEDHMWTSLEKPDGVNGAYALYSHNMTSVQCDRLEDGSKTCYFQIKVIDEVTNISVYNMYTQPPSFKRAQFFYRAAMAQTWNKFCFQGGMLEVRALLPAVTNEQSQNPDMSRGFNARVSSNDFYPTWPGIWMMGNLGRAIFSASTNRMWPYSYSQCDESVFPSHNQRISACNPNPGYGMKPFQGRGAPEIDLLEGGGMGISSSIQIGPGMADKFRLMPFDKKKFPDDYPACIYSFICETKGANIPDVPTAYYASKRGHKSWYQGLRYTGNHLCEPLDTDRQSFSTVSASLKAGITENTCTNDLCPGSFDVHSDLSYIDDDPSKGRWGINEKGACFSVMNGYKGTFLCDPDSQDQRCKEPRNDTTPESNIMPPFSYQMDAISANWGVHVGVYTHYHDYQIEWVLGDDGYIRWMLNGAPIFEIPASSVTNVPQDAAQSNPKRLMPEEPMYLILNVAMSDQWATRPPNGGQACRGDGSNPLANRICDGFPMYMKVDHVRLYQNTRAGSGMSIGCDPESHPTREWIQGHIEEYEDENNKHIDVQGGARCSSHDDCTPDLKIVRVRTGRCRKQRCECTSQFWGGPRCTAQLDLKTGAGKEVRSYGPPLVASIPTGAVAAVLSLIAGFLVSCDNKKRRRQARARSAEESKELGQVYLAFGEGPHDAIKQESPRVL